MRSLLFAPADNPRKLARAFISGADAVIIDLEDSVAETAKATGREGARDFLREARRLPVRPKLLVRVNALDSAEIEADLDAIADVLPDAVVLPKARGGGDVQRLGTKLAVREAEQGAGDASTGVLIIATESAAALFGLQSYAQASRRLIALAWGAEDLSADLGADGARDARGAWREPFRLARNLALFAAAAAGVDPIDTVYVRLRDEKGLRLECEAAQRDGFVGKLAIHPDQVETINAIFTPSRAALERARTIVEAFAARPEAGVLTIDGEMVDRPHLLRAERLLRRAATRKN